MINKNNHDHIYLLLIFDSSLSSSLFTLCFFHSIQMCDTRSDYCQNVNMLTSPALWISRRFIA